MQYETTSKSPILVLDNVGACGRERERNIERGGRGESLLTRQQGWTLLGPAEKGRGVREDHAIHQMDRKYSDRNRTRQTNE